MDINNSGPGVVNTSFGGDQNNYTQGGTNNQQTVNYYQNDRRVLDWLSPSDPTTDHNTARDRHEAGTCEWLLRDDRYKSWKDGETRYLWLYGKPGCGKSVLCSVVIQDLLAEGRNVVYFYFTFSDDKKQSYEDMLRSLVWQLARQEPAKDLLQQACAQSLKSDAYKLEGILIAAAEAGEIIIVLDALDESPETRGVRRDMIRRLVKLTESRVRLLATSRDLLDIRRPMEGLSCVLVEAGPEQVSGDIQHFVKIQLATEERLLDFEPMIKDMIKKNVRRRADGMFRWAALLLAELMNLKTATNKRITAVLEHYPKDLDGVYARMLATLNKDERRDAAKLLRWIVYALKPPTLQELVDVLIIDVDKDTVDFEDRCKPGDVLRILGGLVVTYKTMYHLGQSAKSMWQVVRLAHFTVQEYLESSRSEADFRLSNEQAHLHMTQGCVTYLMHYSSSYRKRSNTWDLTAFPLLLYAAENWYRHSRLHKQDVTASETRLLESGVAMSDWLAVHRPDCYRKPFQYVDEHANSLYYASYLGYGTLAKLLIEAGTAVDAQGGFYNSVLQAASSSGHIEVVKLLLEPGAAVDAKEGHYGDALRAASESGHIKVVRLLLEAGAGVNEKEDPYGFALQAASSSGHIEVVKVLLEAGAAINAGDALAETSRRGHTKIVKLLLETAAAVNRQGGFRGKLLLEGYIGGKRKALQYASERGHVEVVKLLLEGYKADRSVALRAASDEGHTKIVKLLLVGYKGDQGAAFKAASGKGHVEIMKLLLEGYAGDKGRALWLASRFDLIEEVERLLGEGANVNVEEDYEGTTCTSLEVASIRGFARIVEVLLRNGAREGSALKSASNRGHVNVVKLLLEKGVDVDARTAGWAGQTTALEIASAAGHLEVVKLLLAVIGGSSKGSTAKSASEYSHTGASMLLVPKRAEQIDHALRLASRYGHEKVMTLLLDAGADFDNREMTDNRWTALEEASVKHKIHVMKVLLERGAGDKNIALRLAQLEREKHRCSVEHPELPEYYRRQHEEEFERYAQAVAVLQEHGAIEDAFDAAGGIEIPE